MGFPFGASHCIALVERADGELGAVIYGSTPSEHGDPQVVEPLRPSATLLAC